MTSILVTGGAGFIGSNLCKRLLDDGNSVICLDNLYTGRIENIKPFFPNPNFQFINADVIEPYSFDVNQIYNLACPASPPHYQEDAIKTMQTSVFGIINALELSTKCGARVLQASTSEVYGNPLIHPQVESYWGNVNPVGIRSCYDEGKRAAETLVCDYHRQKNADTRIVRIFNTYGPNMAEDDGRVVSNFILQALKGEDITIYGDGTQTRAFCYIDDLIDGLIKMMNNPQSFIGPVNLGNPSERTVLELAKLIIELTNSKSQIIFKELPKDDPVRRNPNISLAIKELNWEPSVDINQGIQKTIEYFKAKLKGVC